MRDRSRHRGQGASLVRETPTAETAILNTETAVQTTKEKVQTILNTHKHKHKQPFIGQSDDKAATSIGKYAETDATSIGKSEDTAATFISGTSRGKSNYATFILLRDVLGARDTNSGDRDSQYAQAQAQAQAALHRAVR